jgi:hypothetical protein
MEVSQVKLNVKQILIYLTIAFVVVTIWNAPATTGNSVGEFLGAVGSWLSDVVDRGASFLKGLRGS